MPMKMRQLFSFFTLFLILTSPGFAQNISTEFLQRAEDHYLRGDYQAAIDWLHGIHGMLSPVPRLTRLEKETRARVYFDLGCCYLGIGDSTLAEQTFRRAFTLDASLKQGHFSDANPGTFWQDLLDQKEHARRLKTTWRSAMMRSAILPGWGQLYRGHKKKAIGLMGTSLTAAFVWAVQYHSFRSARSEYKNANRHLAFGITHNNDDGTLHTEFEARHRLAQSRARQANKTLAVLGILWFLGFSDSIFTGPAGVNITISF